MGHKLNTASSTPHLPFVWDNQYAVMHHHAKYSVGSGSADFALTRTRGSLGARSQSPAATTTSAAAPHPSVAAVAGASSHSANSASPAHGGYAPNGLHAATNGHAAHSGGASTSGAVGIPAASAVESFSTSEAEGRGRGVCCYHCTGHLNQNCSSSQSSFSAMLNGNHAPQTIEDQIRAVDKVVKECDNSRKTLEGLSRRLDDLNDEVKRYREFLGHEKSRRDPALYKTTTSDQPSQYNERICGIMSTLTYQLTNEWNDKLGKISTSLLSPSTPGAKMPDRN